VPDHLHNRDFGSEGEDCAAAFLENNRFIIIARNYRFGKYGEIDIIARRENLVIFAEVKHRGTERYGGALYSISSKKKKSIKTAARAFISASPDYDRSEITFRFDMISIQNNSIEWIEDMFR
jgi:putative endonuclease